MSEEIPETPSRPDWPVDETLDGRRIHSVTLHHVQDRAGSIDPQRVPS